MGSGKVDGFVNSPISALRFIALSLQRTGSTPHSAGFARLELGLFTKPSIRMASFRFIDLHVHGGLNCDFMDGTPEAFHTVCKAHLKHGTTSLLATSTAATMPTILKFLETCRASKSANWTDAAQVLGAHFYGPYFFAEARGCHPSEPIVAPTPDHFNSFLDYADTIITASVAPELPGAEAFVKACLDKNIRCNAGHSHATFSQVEAAVQWGVRHVDHLFCAMSDRARLRLEQTYPMRGGLMEATYTSAICRRWWAVLLTGLPAG